MKLSLLCMFHLWSLLVFFVMLLLILLHLFLARILSWSSIHAACVCTCFLDKPQTSELKLSSSMPPAVVIKGGTGDMEVDLCNSPGCIHTGKPALNFNSSWYIYGKDCGVSWCLMNIKYYNY